MPSVSGKFVPKRKVSTFVNNAEPTDVATIASKVPPVPTASKKSCNNIAVFLEEYFGKFWWLWIIVLITLKSKNS